MNKGNEKSQNLLVAVLSVVLIGVVAFLYLGPDLGNLGIDKRTLPFLNSIINGITTLVLIAAVVTIRNGRIGAHKRLMLTAVGLSIVFLVLYVVQHGSFESTTYAGPIKGIYFFILISHILLAAAIVPLVLLTLVRALSERFDKHRKIARITLPLWLYVSITGVIVYLMIEPYY
jgi:putative membrane protein